MYSTTTLFFTLSALVATSRGRPSAYDLSAPVAPVRAIFAGAPSDGRYPADMEDASGWSAEAYAPVHDVPTDAVVDTTVTWSTTIDAGAYATPVHGSGSTPPTDLDSCVQVCQAQYGGAGLSSAVTTHEATPSTAAASAPATASAHATSAPAAGGSAAPTSAGAAASGGGGGGGTKTHTIIVAPTQGVLRFVPFAIKAEQGDTLEYIWGGGPHSATLSNGTNICAKSTEPNAWDSGNLNVTQTFTTVYDKNTTGLTFYYCKVGQHCANGMFGIINNVTNELTDKATKSTPPRPDSTAGSGGKTAPGVDGWITSWAVTNPDNQKKVDAVKAACKDSPGSWDWGSNWEWDSMLSTSVTKEIIVENTLYTRLMATYNPAMLKDEPFGKDWKAAPDLTSFAADYAGAGAGASSAGGAYGGSATTGTGSSVSASVGAAGSSASADAASAGNGAGRAGPSSLLASMAALGVGALLM